MKKSYNLIAALLIIIWAFMYFGFDVHRTIHTLPLFACLIILANTIGLKKQISK